MHKKQINAENTSPSSLPPGSKTGSSVDQHSANSSSSTSVSFSGNASIGASVRVTGDIAGNENLVIYGHVSGSISFPKKMVTIGKKASVDAHVSANSVDIEGKVSGTIQATDIVRVSPSGHVIGDIAAPRVVLEDGCQFRGGIDMLEQKIIDAKKGTDVATKSAGSVKPANTGQDQLKKENAAKEY